MTLVGLLPPICENGHLLVDGGYSTFQVNLVPFSMAYGFSVDNLPVAKMSAIGASTIFACDVGAVRINDLFQIHSLMPTLL
jgi:lysophospholipid hydrolase